MKYSKHLKIPIDSLLKFYAQILTNDLSIFVPLRFLSGGKEKKKGKKNDKGGNINRSP